MIKISLVAICTLLLISCASNQVSQSEVQSKTYASQQEKRKLNEKLAAAASQFSVINQYNNADYKLGAGDLLEVTVFQVDELNTKARVNGAGMIILPLLGEVDVKGLTTTEVDELVTQKLAADYLHDPQVSIFISEYKSQQIPVMGAVNQAKVHNLTRPRTVLELITMSGGLSDVAGSKIYVQTSLVNPQTGQLEPHSIIIDINEIIDSGNADYNIVLNGGDSIYVPEAGVVFVEGSVVKPGAYPIQGEMGVLKAIAIAGGTVFEANEGAIQIIRNGSLEEVATINLKAIRSGNSDDILLEDGDIVVVRSNSLKKGWASFWKGLTGIVNINRGI